MNDNIDFIETDWDRSEYEPCNPHDLAINDFAQMQCTHCLSLFSKTHEYTVARQCLEALHGEPWKAEWERLKRIRAKVAARDFTNLREEYCTYRLSDGTIKPDRTFFYEKSE